MIEITQWLSTFSKSSFDLESLNNYLQTKTFLVSMSLSLADIVFFDALMNKDLVTFEKSKWPEISRWLEHIYSLSAYNIADFVVQKPITIFPVIKTTKVLSALTGIKESTASHSADHVGLNCEESKPIINKSTQEKKVKKEKSVEAVEEAVSGAAAAADADLDPSKLDIIFQLRKM